MKLHLSESYKKRLQELSGINEAITESDIYYETLNAALDAAVEKARVKGYEVDQDELFQFGIGGISYGQSKRYTFSLTQNGQPSRRVLVVSIYRMPSGRYELTSYVG